MKRFLFLTLSLCLCSALLALSVAAQIPQPKDLLGFTPGDDRKLASWASIVDYFKKLDKASDRVLFEEIGKTTMGAPFVYATISSPENLKKLDEYKEINAELADPRIMARRRATTDTYARINIRKGKTIVMITCGIHSTEVGSTLSSMLIAYKLASSNEPEIKNILENTIILLVPSLNPDGVDIVKNWYDKTLGTPFEGTEPPELYHKYVGHDNNRDWYAFTQVETQLTVDKIHNVWHPQIVLDVHQQGPNGARQFLPPYMAPVEPNVPKQIVEGFTELGNYMAGDLRKKGLLGITTNTTYDAWTPARAYSHYHGGVRILSETASAKLATPITVKFEDLRGAAGGLDAKVESPNFGPVWKGGEWKLRNITDYMTATAFSLLDHAANNREKWLSRFYEIGKEAVRPRKDGELRAFIIDFDRPGECWFLLQALDNAGVEYTQAREFTLNGRKHAEGTPIIRLDQPYGSFAKAIIEQQKYPNLMDSQGHPIAPYDVTAHTLSSLTATQVVEVFKPFKIPSQLSSKSTKVPATDFEELFEELSREPPKPKLALYASSAPSMDEGWTRWIFEDGLIGSIMAPERLHKGKFKRTVNYRSIRNLEIRAAIETPTQTIIFPDQSPNQILNGYAKGSMPDEYTGGVGKEGVENLKKFVEAGGTLVFLNRSSDFAIEQFNLPIRDVTKGLDRKDFYIPGSILRIGIDIRSAIGEGMPQESIAWFENSPAFEITDPNERGPYDLTKKVRVIAGYPSDPTKILLSGWALGAEKIAGKAALVEVKVGKGKIILFGFRPQYRGQSLATFPLLFNAISQ